MFDFKPKPLYCHQDYEAEYSPEAKSAWQRRPASNTKPSTFGSLTAPDQFTRAAYQAKVQFVALQCGCRETSHETVDSLRMEHVAHAEHVSDTASCLSRPRSSY